MSNVYAVKADLVIFGVPQAAFGSLTDAQINGALASASATIDRYLRGRFRLPLLAWGIELKKACCILAAYELMQLRGWNPTAGGDIELKTSASETLDWLREAQRGAAHPDVTPALDQPSFNQPKNFSQPPRGW